ncbi:MAG: SDR family NAD(P)-dependent oxidoreductase [Bacteroidota bacterium]
MSTTAARVLVTGATGMVGAAICHKLATEGRKIRALHRNTSSMEVVERFFLPGDSLLSDAVEWVEGDVTDVISIRDAMQGVDEVYHTAAIVSFDPADRERLFATNVDGTTNLVNMALEAGVSRFCHISSVAALGRVSEGQMVDENSSWRNSNHNTDYAKTKYAAEMEVWRGFEEGLKGFIVNPTIILGPAAWSAGSGLLFKTVWEGLKFYPEGANGFVDVRDVAGAAVSLMDSGVHGERFILVSENIPYQLLFESIAQSLGKKPPAVKITRSIAELAWRIDWLRAKLPGNKPLLTREMAHTSTHRWSYSNSKVKQATGMEFISVEKSVAHWAEVFLKTYSKSSMR